MPPPEAVLSVEDAAQLVDGVCALTAARTPAEVMATAARWARAATGADGATFVVRDGDHCCYAEEDAIAPLWKGQRFPAAACLPGWAMRHREAVAIEDVYADPRIAADAYRPTFVASLAMAPVRRGDPIAAVGAYWARRHLASPRELALLQGLADAAAVALDGVARHAEAERAIRLRDEFLSLASHELKTPLTALVLQVDAIEHHRGTVAEGRVWQRLRGQIDRLDRLVDDLLDASRIATPQLRLAIRDADLRELATEVVADLRDVARGHGVELRLAAEQVRLACDPHRIAQLVANLVGNAIKFGDGKPVDVEVFAAGGAAQLIVRDRGRGIAPDHQARIFERFFRATSAGRAGGLGLGLWIAKEIVERHGGQIRVESVLGQGATFTVSLPLTERS